MFERFTERAERVIILAKKEAKRLNQSAVGTEHILLGIIREGEGHASKVLESLNISPDRLRAGIESASGRGEWPPYEEVAFNPRARKVLELALDEAHKMRHNYIGTEHLLLGLIREGEGVAARVLGAMGADLERTRARVARILKEQKGARGVEGPTFGRSRGFHGAFGVIQKIVFLIRIRLARKRLIRTAATGVDLLTGLADRRSFSDRFAAELAHGGRADRPVSIAVLDLDGFKAINDAHGHRVGDQVLIQVAETLKRSIRPSDLAARHGGDDFILMFPEMPFAQAEALVARLRPIEISVPKNGSTQRLHMSFCWGTAAWPEDGEALEQLVQIADGRLYERRHRPPDNKEAADEVKAILSRSLGELSLIVNQQIQFPSSFPYEVLGRQVTALGIDEARIYWQGIAARVSVSINALLASRETAGTSGAKRKEDFRGIVLVQANVVGAKIAGFDDLEFVPPVMLQTWPEDL